MTAKDTETECFATGLEALAIAIEETVAEMLVVVQVIAGNVPT